MGRRDLGILARYVLVIVTIRSFSDLLTRTVDVVLATKLSIYGGGSWSGESLTATRPVISRTNFVASTCSKMGALCAFVWIQWILLTARMIVMLAETARLRFQHMMEALRSKLAPWWKAVKNPFVQILASVGVLLSGVVGSLGMLVTGVVGVVDKGLGVVGLGGIRRKIFDIAGLGKVTSHMDKALSGVGLGGIIGQDESDKQGDGGGGLDQIKESVGLDSSGPDKNETQLAGSSLSNMLGTGKADSEETKSGKTRKRSSKSEKNLD